MWSFVQVARIEPHHAQWQALITLTNSGTPESFFTRFAQEPSQQDAATRGAALVDQLNETGAETELDGFLANQTFVSPQWQTGAQLATRFRRRFLTATRQDASQMAYWLVERVAAGSFTQLQVRTAFGFTVAEYNAFATRMQTLHDHWASVLSAQGE